MSSFRRTYYTWSNMIQRCSNTKHARYKDYGGRGITVCEKWKKWSGFFEDMGRRPEGFEIERVDNNKGYCKENCIWATQQTNAQNRRKYTNNISGTPGVSWKATSRKWVVHVPLNPGRKYLGSFSSLEEAVKVRNSYGSF